MSDFDSYLTDNHDRFESDLFEWLRMPSIGTDSAFDKDVRQAADWLADKLRALDLKTEIIETCGHPLVYAESPKNRRRSHRSGLWTLRCPATGSI
jgi:succinyl-diaminopimelate desuccinylase